MLFTKRTCVKAVVALMMRFRPSKMQFRSENKKVIHEMESDTYDTATSKCFDLTIHACMYTRSVQKVPSLLPPKVKPMPPKWSDGLGLQLLYYAGVQRYMQIGRVVFYLICLERRRVVWLCARQIFTVKRNDRTHRLEIDVATSSVKSCVIVMVEQSGKFNRRMEMLR